MNPHPAPSVTGNTDWERFDSAVRKVFSVHPEAIQREKDRAKSARDKKSNKKAKVPITTRPT
jgi:hypothetical protein